MIDEERLTELLHDLGATIEVPPDGPTRVLAQRDAMRRVGPHRAVFGVARPQPDTGAGRRGRLAPWVRRSGAALAATATLVAALALTLIIVRSPGGSDKSSSSAPSQPFNGPVAGALKAAPGGESAASSAGPATSAAAAAAGPTPGAPANGAVGSGAGDNGTAGVGPSATVPGLTTEVVKTGSIDLVVKAGQLGGTIDQLTTMAAGLGGFVASSQTTEGGTSPTGDLTLRVPAAHFEQLLTQVRALGRPVSVTAAGQDVTAQYVDLQARIDALEATRQQFLQILAKAQQIGDILAVEQQINDLQVQIEQLQGQLRVLDDQATYSTLSVHLTEQGAASPVPTPHPGGLSAAWAHARHSFATGLEAVVSWAGGFAVFLVCLATLGLLARLTWSVVRRRLV